MHTQFSINLTTNIEKLVSNNFTYVMVIRTLEMNKSLMRCTIVFIVWYGEDLISYFISFLIFGSFHLFFLIFSIKIPIWHVFSLVLDHCVEYLILQKTKLVVYNIISISETLGPWNYILIKNNNQIILICNLDKKKLSLSETDQSDFPCSLPFGSALHLIITSNVLNHLFIYKTVKCINLY